MAPNKPSDKAMAAARAVNSFLDVEGKLRNVNSANDHDQLDMAVAAIIDAALAPPQGERRAEGFVVLDEDNKIIAIGNGDVDNIEDVLFPLDDEDQEKPYKAVRATITYTVPDGGEEGQ